VTSKQEDWGIVYSGKGVLWLGISRRKKVAGNQRKKQPATRFGGKTEGLICGKSGGGGVEGKTGDDYFGNRGQPLN